VDIPTFSTRLALVAVCGGLLLGCGSSTPGGSGHAGHRLAVVAAENFWGSIAGQLGGSEVSVTSVVSDPNADPHDYQSSAATARAFATADYVIVNGAGYDGWADSLLNANPSSTRTVLDVADLLGRKEGDNPHFWYSPTDVENVADRITRDLESIDGADGAAFARQRTSFEAALQPYHARIAEIRQRFGGTKVAATESIFVSMAGALGLDLISPPEFMKAVAEGNDPPASSVSAFHEQLQSGQAKLLVYNRQTATDVTTTLRQIAAQQHIPVVGVTETMQPPTTSFQLWMTAQLADIENALAAAAPSPSS